MVSCLKLSFCFVTIVCAITIIGLAGGGVWYSLQVKQLTDLRNYETYQLDFRIRWPQILPYIFAAVGTFGLLIIFCGLCGFTSRGCLLMYSICSSIFFLTVVGVGVMAILLAVNSSDEFVRETLNSAFHEASAKPDVRVKFEEFETSLHCCGVDGPINYHVQYGPSTKLPKSCCPGPVCTVDVHGCFKVASKFTMLAYYVGTGLCGLIAILTLASIVFAVTIVRKKQLKAKEIS